MSKRAKATVPREAFDGLANAYWLRSNMAHSARCDALGRTFDIDEFHRSIDRDLFWSEACNLLEPGLRAGLRTSMTVAESIERKAKFEGKGS